MTSHNHSNVFKYIKLNLKKNDKPQSFKCVQVHQVEHQKNDKQQSLTCVQVHQVEPQKNDKPQSLKCVQVHQVEPQKNDKPQSLKCIQRLVVLSRTETQHQHHYLMTISKCR